MPLGEVRRFLHMFSFTNHYPYIEYTTLYEQTHSHDKTAHAQIHGPEYTSQLES